jgi:TP901 family phage tail tape measure protein
MECKLQTQYKGGKQMTSGSNDYKLVLSASLNPKEVKTQLDQIAKDYVFKLKIQADDKGLDQVTGKIEQIQKKVASSSSTKVRIIDANSTLTDLDKIKRKIEEIQNTKGKNAAQISYDVDPKGNVQQVNATYENAGKIVQERWLPAVREVNGELQKTNLLALDHTRLVDKIAQTEKTIATEVKNDTNVQDKKKQQIEAMWQAQEKVYAQEDAAYEEQLRQSQENMDKIYRTKQEESDKEIALINKQKQAYAEALDKEAESAIEASRKQSEQLEKENKKRLEDLKKLEDQANKFLEKTKFLSSSNPEVAKGIDIANQLNASVAADKATGKLSESTKQLGRDLAVVNEGVRTGGRSLQSWSQEIGIAVKRTIEWSIGIGAVYGVLNQLKEGFNYIKELNKVMTDTAVVTGMNSEQTNALAKQYNILARDLGSTTKAVAEGGLEFQRQGKSIEETTELLRTATILSKLGNMASAESTEKLTATLNGFKMEASDAIGVVDRLVSLDNRFATSVNEITTAMQYSAAVANQAGVSFDELASYITVISSVMRVSAETVGQSIKTMLTRFEQVKVGKLFEDDPTTINQVAESLHAVGVELMKDANTFRPLGDVLEELAGKWDTLTVKQQNAVAGTVAGLRQVPQFLTLMQNFDSVMKAQEIEANSAGLAMDRYNIYLENAEAAANRLTTAWESMWQKTLDSKSIIGLYNIGTALVEIMDKAGGLVPVLGLVTAALIALNGASIDKAISGLISQITGIIAALTATQTAATATGLAVSTAFGIVGIAITAAVIGYNLFSAANEDSLEKVERLSGEIDNLKNSLGTLNSQQSRINKLGDEFENLRKNTSRSYMEQKRFTELQNEIKDMFPTINGYYDEYGNYILHASVNLAELNKLKAEEIRLEKERLGLKVQDSMQERVKLYEESIKKIKDAEDEYNRILKNQQKAAIIKGDNNWGVSEEQQKKNAAKQKQDLQNAINDVKEAKNASQQAINDIKKDFYLLTKEEQAGTIAILKNMGDFGTEIARQLELAAIPLDRWAQEWRGAASDIKGSIKSIVDEIKGLQTDSKSAIDLVQKSMEGGFTFDDVAGLEALFPEGGDLPYDYLDMIDVANGKLKINTDMIRENAIATAQKTLDDKEAALAKDQSNASLQKEVEMMQSYLRQLQQAIPQSNDFVDSFDLMIKTIAAGMTSSELENGFGNLASALLEVDDQFKNGMLTSAEYFDAINAHLEDLDFAEVFGENQLAADTFFAGLAQNAITSTSNINAAFESGDMLVTDYVDNLAGITESYETMGDGLLDYYDTLGLSEEVAAEMKDDVTGAMEDIQTSTESLIGLQELNGQVQAAMAAQAADTLQFGTDAYNKVMMDMATTAANSGMMFEDANGNMLTSAESIYSYLTANAGNFGSFADQTAAKTGELVSSLFTGIGNLMQSVGNAIKNFKAELHIVPTVTPGPTIILPGMDPVVLPSIKYTMSTTGGDSFAQIAQAAFDFSKVISNMKPIKWDSSIYTLPKEINQVSGAAGGASGALDDLSNSLVKSANAGGDAKKKTKELTKSIKELLNQTINLIQEQKKAEKDLLKAQLDGYKKVIDSRKKILDQLLEEKERKDDLTEHEKDISSIQNELLELQFDTSQEAMAKRLELQDQLAEAQKKLADFQFKNGIEDQKDALDSDYDKYKEIIDAKIAVIDAYLDRPGQIAIDALKMIQEKGTTLYDQLIEWNRQYGSGLDEEVVKPWEEAYEIIKKFKGDLHEIATKYKVTVSADTEEHHSGVYSGPVGGKFALKSNEEFAKLLKGEVVYTPEQIDNFMNKTLPKIANPQYESSGGGGLNIETFCKLVVEGNLDKTVLPDLDKIMNKVFEKLNSTMHNTGHMRNAATFAR